MSEPAETRRLRKLAHTEQLPDDFSVERSRAPEDEDEDEARANPGMAIRKARVLSKMFGTAAKPVSIGRFVLLELLGAGAMGEVYAGYDGELDRKVAIKLVRVGLGLVIRPTSGCSMRPKFWLSCRTPTWFRYTRPGAPGGGVGG